MFFYNRANDFDGNTVGIAYLNALCGSASVGVVQDSHYSSASTGSTFAHELGHLFSCDHDISECLCICSIVRMYIDCGCNAHSYSILLELSQNIVQPVSPPS